MGWKLLFSPVMLLFVFHLKGQPANCTFKPPAITIHFGTGNVRDANTESLGSYFRVGTSCPTDGHYSYTPSTSRCFSDDWHTLDEDHTPGDAGGNMLLVNASPYRGIFFTSTVGELKPNTLYEFGVWFMNLCKPTEKCPFPLLPNISIRIESEDGKVVASFNTGDLDRVESPRWSQHKAYFTTPATSASLTLVMAYNNPGGCGNDFAMDDLTFRECIKIPPPVATTTKTVAPKTTTPKTTAPKATVPKSSTEKKPPATVKTTPKKTTPPPSPVKEAKVSQVAKPNDSTGKSISVIKQGRQVFPPPPLVLKTRENELVKRIEIDAGEIKVEL